MSAGPVREGPHLGPLRSRPVASASSELRPGTTALGLARGRDGLLHLPAAAAAADGPIALVVALHGAGAAAGDVLRLFAGPAEECGLAVLAPDARGRTWDVVGGSFGADVEFIDRALAHVFARLAVDPARVVVAGFSDGASYALSLGIADGDLFSDVIAFSPGFAVAEVEVGRPRMFVTHGVHDRVLPIARSCRACVAPATTSPTRSSTAATRCRRSSPRTRCRGSDHEDRAAT